MTTTRFRRLARVAAAGAVVAAVGMGAQSPASAAGSFSSQWADAAWTGQAGSGTNTLRWDVTMAPGMDDFNGQRTEYLKTTLTASYCDSSYLYEAKLAKMEQAADLKGVDVRTLNRRATVNRSTSLPGTLSRIPARNCVPTAEAVSTSDVTLPVTLKATWTNTSSAIVYTGEDCGGTGNCTYYDAKASTGSAQMSGKSFNLGAATSAAWLWYGAYAL